MRRRSQPLIDLKFDPEIEATARRLNAERRRRKASTSPASLPLSPTPQMANPPALFGHLNAPGTHEYGVGVTIPAPPANYTIHPSHSRQVRDHAFTGSRHECPLKHINDFMKTINLLPPCAEQPDYPMLALFHLSLMGDAEDWYQCLEPGTITTWAQLKQRFLERFYPTLRTNDLTSQITSFAQADDESFSDAWIRFKRLQRQCPHHGFGDNHLNKFFYNGLTDHTKTLVDSAVGGQLSKVPQTEVKAKFEELAASATWSGIRRSTPRGMLDTSNTTSTIKEELQNVQKQLAALTAGSKSSQSNVSAASSSELGFSCTICGGTNHDRSYCGGAQPIHIAAIGCDTNENYQEDQQFPYYDGQGYVAEHAAAVYGLPNQEVTSQSFINQPYANQPYRTPFNNNPNSGNFN